MARKPKVLCAFCQNPIKDDDAEAYRHESGDMHADCWETFREGNRRAFYRDWEDRVLSTAELDLEAARATREREAARATAEKYGGVSEALDSVIGMDEDE